MFLARNSRRCAALAVAMGALQPRSCTAVDTGVGERFSHGFFHEVRIYLPRPPAQHLVLLRSGDGGWGRPLPEIARRQLAPPGPA